MFEAVRNIERVETLGRADSEVTVATVETFLSDVHCITDITGHPEEGHTNNNNKNTEDLLNKGVLYHFFYRHIGTIILICTCLYRHTNTHFKINPSIVCLFTCLFQSSACCVEGAWSSWQLATWSRWWSAGNGEYSYDFSFK